MLIIFSKNSIIIVIFSPQIQLAEEKEKVLFLCTRTLVSTDQQISCNILDDCTYPYRLKVLVPLKFPKHNSMSNFKDEFPIFSNMVVTGYFGYMIWSVDIGLNLLDKQQSKYRVLFEQSSWLLSLRQLYVINDAIGGYEKVYWYLKELDKFLNLWIELMS